MWQCFDLNANINMLTRYNDNAYMLKLSRDIMFII